MNSKRIWPLAAVLLAVVVYLVLFYAAPFPGLQGDDGQPLVRAEYFFYFLLCPDDLAITWFGTPPSFAILDRAVVLAVAASVLACAFCLGWLLMRLCRCDRGLTRLETFVFSTAVGLNAVSTYVLVVGLLGLLGYRLVFILPGLLVPAFAGWAQFGRKVRAPAVDAEPEEFLEDTSDDGDSGNWLSGRWLWLAAPFVLVILLGGMLPPTEFDVREYHLEAPKEFFQQGYIGFLPHNLYGNMALGTDMLSLLGMVLVGDWWLGALVGKTLIAAFAPLTALGLLAAGRRFLSPAAGIVAAVVFISTPWIAHVSTCGLVEGASALYLLMAWYAVMLATKDDTSLLSSQSAAKRTMLPSLILAGYLAGGAVACKYPGVLFVVFPLAAWIATKGVRTRFRSSRSKNAGRHCFPVGSRWLSPLWDSLWDSKRFLTPFLLAVVVGCGLWFGKNWVLAGNPTYPLMYGLFGGKTWTAEKTQMWNHVHLPRDFSAWALWNDLGRVVLGSDWHSPLLIPLAVLAFIRPKHRRLSVALAAYFGFIIAAWWFLALRIDRYWIHGLPLVALLAGIGACWSRQRPWRTAVLVLLVIGCLSNFLVVASPPCVYNRFFVPLERLRYSPERVAPWHAYFNQHAADGRVLLVGEAQVFDLEVPILYNTWLDDSIFERLVRDPRTGRLRPAEEVRAAFLAEGISHVYVHWGELTRYRRTEYGDTSFIQPEVFDTLVAHGVLEPIPLTDELRQHPGRGYRVLAGEAD